MNKNIDGFIRNINSINTIFVILLTAFPHYIATLLQTEIQPFQTDHILWFTIFVLIFFVVIYSKFFRLKRLNIDMTKQATKIAERVSVGILFFMPLLVVYFFYLEKNYGLHVNNNIGNVLLLIPFGITISAAVSQSAYIIEKKSNLRKLILLMSTILLFLVSIANIALTSVQILIFIYFSLLFVLSSVKEN